jgi:hypothetical protein
MNFSKHDFVTVNDILADALKLVGDVDMKINTKGWYTSQVQQSLNELSYDTFFLDVHKSFPVPENLKLDLPKGSFNLQNIYGFNGDECHSEGRVNIYHKKDFIGDKSGKNYFAKDNYSNVNDRFHKRRRSYKNTPDNVFFYNIQAGIIHLSPNCSCFDNVMLVYSGVQGDMGDVPVVPTYLRQVVKTMIIVNALEVKLATAVGTNSYNHITNLYNTHLNKLNHPYDGLLDEAKRRVKTLDSKHRRDIKMYFQKMNY